LIREFTGVTIQKSRRTPRIGGVLATQPLGHVKPRTRARAFVSEMPPRTTSRGSDSRAPFVLDLEKASAFRLGGDFITLVGELRRRKITLVGVQNGTIEQNRGALSAGLLTLQGGRDQPNDSAKGSAATESTAQAESEPQTSRALLITEPVRSGQQIFAEDGDLIVLASVSSGAELIARGNIHIYGRMRGRALAGVNGDRQARIFCQALDAELIAIAGLYKISDEFPPEARKQRVQVHLKNEELRIEPLK
jgi:septum site-determining protein MinC